MHEGLEAGRCRKARGVKLTTQVSYPERKGSWLQDTLVGNC